MGDWNLKCHIEQQKLFGRVRSRLPDLIRKIEVEHLAQVYEDAYSPFCLVAPSNAAADVILREVEAVFEDVPELSIVRNDIYARFSHSAYNKGSAMAEIGKRIGVKPSHTFAAGDHLNDIPMLSSRYARWLAAPFNAVPEVKELVLRQNGYVSPETAGKGIADSLATYLEQARAKS